MIPTFLVLTLAAVGGIMFWPTIQANLFKDEAVALVMIDFDPPERSGEIPKGRSFPDAVFVSIQVSKRIRPKEKVLESGKVWGVNPGPGEPVDVIANQAYGTRLRCSISDSSTGGTIVAQHEIWVVGQVHCKWTRPK